MKQRQSIIQQGQIDQTNQPLKVPDTLENNQSKRSTKKKNLIAALKNNPQRLDNLRQSLKYFTPLKKNIYLDRKRRLPKNDEMQPCYCRPREQLDMSIQYNNISYNCGQSCLNRMMSTECDDDTCNCGQFCQNRKFQKHQYAHIYPMPQGGKGWGLCAGQRLPRGTFIMQYIGQIFSTNSQFGKARVKQYSKSTCTYLMKTSKGQVIDPTYKGNLARFINHSCQPNCITQKWNVLGQICIGIFAIKDIEEDEQLTFDYQFDVYSTPLTKCLCGSKKCKGYLGLKPTDITAQQWNQRLEDMTCQICQKNYDDDDVKLIICDDCNMGFHIYCLSPPLQKIPQQSFFCKQCQTKRIEERDRLQKQTRMRLIQLKNKQLQQQKNRNQSSDQQENTPVDLQYQKFFSFIKKKQKQATKQLIRDNQKHKNKQKSQKKNIVTQTPKKQQKQNNIIKRINPVNKKRDQYYQVCRKAVDRFQVYLQNNQKFYQQINNFGGKKTQKNQDQKKAMQLNKIQMQLILKSNFILFEKIGAQIYFDMQKRNSADFFFKNIQVIVTGNEEQIKMFQKIVSISNQIINDLQVQMGITQACIAIPALFLKRLLGPGQAYISQIQKMSQVAVYYHRQFLNGEECYSLDTTCKLLLKGGKQNICKAYEQIKKRISTFEVQRLYFNPYEIKTVMNNMPTLKRKVGIAEFRIGKQSPFKQINHPFYYIQQKNKQIAIIGTRSQIQKTRKEIMSFFQEPNRKQQYNFNISLYLAQQNQKPALLSIKNQLQKDIPTIKMMIFDPTPPRKNMTLSFLGTRQNRQKAKQYLFKKAQAFNKQGKLIGNLQYFQDQMNYQMTKYYFKYMQNMLLTKDTAFMKSWDILNVHFFDQNPNYMWRSVKKLLFADYQTMLYACFVLKQKIIAKIIKQNKSNNTILQQVFDVIKQNITRILNVYNVNSTYGLKNYSSCIDSQEAKKSFKDVYPHINYIKSQIALKTSFEGQDIKNKQKQLSYFQKKVFRKYKNLALILEEENKKDKEKEERKSDKWR